MGLFLRINILLLSVLLGLSSNAQVIIHGQVRDSASFIGIPNSHVNIFCDSAVAPYYGYQNIVLTDNQGYFTDTIPFQGSANIRVVASTMDCHQHIVSDTFYSVFPFPLLLSVCNGNNGCYADYIAYPDSGNYKQYYFVNLSSTNNSSYWWDFGNGNFSTAKNPTHTFATGNYQVCLTATDSNTNCSNTFCDIVSVSPVMNCQNSFSYYFTPPRNVTFTGQINGTFPTLYNWDFGDQSTGNGRQIQHQYNQPGTYTVQLRSLSLHPQTLDTCVSFSQQTVSVTGSPTAGLWGQVFADSHPVDSGFVQLYRLINVPPEFVLVDSSMVRSNDSLGISFYEFSGLPYGKYVAKLNLLPTSTFVGNYAPAYAGNTIYWDLAQSNTLHQVSTNQPINLTHLYPRTGNSSISGHVIEEFKQLPGDPLPFVPIYLLDHNQAAVGFTYTDSSGYYEFNDLTIQRYSVYPDLINYQIVPAIGHITSANQQITGIDIYVSQNGATEINSPTQPIDFKLFPNPTTGWLTLRLQCRIQGVSNYIIYNAIGQIVLSNQLDDNDNQINEFQINLSELPKGMFFIQIQSQEMISSSKAFIIAR